MDQKQCKRCLQIKSTVEFNRHSIKKDNLCIYCKSCVKKKAAEFYQKNREKLIKQVISYKKTEKGKESRKNANRKWRRQNPQKANAHVKVKKAIDKGKIIRQPCCICGKYAEAHHEDYSKPLEVVWLCKRHHLEYHAGNCKIPISLSPSRHHHSFSELVHVPLRAWTLLPR